MTIAQHHPEPADVTPGSAPPCADDCEARELCVTCGEPLCPGHEPAAVVACADGGFHHVDGCAYPCGPCDDAAWWDAETDRGDAIRKGEWI